MLRFVNSCDKKFGLIEYRSRRNGSYVFSPVYSPLEIIVSAREKQGFRGRKEMLVIYEKTDKELISPIEFRMLKGDCIERILVGEDDGYDAYILTPSSNGDVVVKFLLGLRSIDFKNSDVNHDNHMSGFLLSFAENLLHGTGIADGGNKLKLAREAYSYIHRMPTTPYKPKTEKVKTPTKAIESGKAHDICVCKSEIFKDLCKLLGIPAREQIAEHYIKEEIKEYSKTKREPRKNTLHSFCAFFADQWRLADPTLGGFDKSFRFKEYYGEIFLAKGFESIVVEARKL